MAPLQNIYYERKAATAKACFVCRTPSTTVLATVDTKDFIYTCEKHLSDPGFATLIPEPPAATGPSKEDIAKVIQEHKKKEADRADKAKQTEKQDAEEKGKGDSKDSEESKPKPASSPSPPSTIHIPESSAPTPSKHRRFALHRGIFSMRERDVRSREHVAKAKEVGKGLPQVPRGQI